MFLAYNIANHVSFMAYAAKLQVIKAIAPREEINPMNCSFVNISKTLGLGEQNISSEVKYFASIYCHIKQTQRRLCFR